MEQVLRVKVRKPADKRVAAPEQSRKSCPKMEPERCKENAGRARKRPLP